MNTKAKNWTIDLIRAVKIGRPYQCLVCGTRRYLLYDLPDGNPLKWCPRCKRKLVEIPDDFMT